MSPFLAFVLGAFVGWLVEWVIDWVYWRRRWQTLQESAARCEHEKAALEAELSVLHKVPPIPAARTGGLEPISINLPQAVQEPSPLPGPVPDDLEVIKGIGPVIARLLNQAGIFTFDQLSHQTPESLRGILGDQIKRLADEEELIRQAGELAHRRQYPGA